jgi:hypothetical protein
MARSINPQYTDDLIWDPYSTLKICNQERGINTCIGWAPSKRRRCQYPTNASRRKEANLLLEAISEMEPNFDELEGDLRLLVSCCMCKSLHNTRKQVDAVLSEWEILIKAEQKRIRSRRRQMKRYLENRSSLQKPSSQLRSSQYQHQQHQTKPRIAFYDRSSSQRPFRTIEQVKPSLSDINLKKEQKSLDALSWNGIQKKVEHLNDDSEDEASEDEDSEDEVVDPVPIEAETVNFNQPAKIEDEKDVQTPITPQRTRVVTLNEEDTEGVSISPPESTKRLLEQHLLITSNPGDPCVAKHVIRRPISEECLICKESCDEATLRDLTWCKSRCGHNMHKICVNEYLDFYSSQGRSIKCPHWYVFLAFHYDYPC